MTSSRRLWYRPSTWFPGDHPPDWVLLLVLIAGIYLWQRTVFPPWMCDCFPNQFGAYCFAHGDYDRMYVDMTRIDDWIEHNQSIADSLGVVGVFSPYLYSPAIAAILSPFEGYSALQWQYAQLVVNILLLFVIAWLIAKLIAETITWRGYLWALGLMLILYPMARATKLGQLVPILAAIFWLGILLVQRRRELTGGVLLGLVGAIKLFPLAVLPVLFYHRKFRASLAAIATVIVFYGVSLLTIGLDLHQSWWQAMRGFGGMVCPFWGNQSLLGWWTRITMDFPLEFADLITSPQIRIVKFTIMLVIGGITAYAFLKNWKRRDSNFPVDAGLILLASFLAIPIAWEHYLLFVVPALGIAIYAVYRSGDTTFWEWFLGAALFFITMKLTRFNGETPFGRFMSGSQTIGMVLFWIWLVRSKLRIAR